MGCDNIEQAGIENIELIEDKELILTYNIDDEVVYVSSSGQTINIDNEDEVEFTEELIRNQNNRLAYKFNISYKEYGITEINNQLIQDIISSIYGWIAILNYYNGTKKVIVQPIRFSESDIDNNTSAHFNITLTNGILINAEDKKPYVPGIWILATGFWNDLGIWIDTEVWID